MSIHQTIVLVLVLLACLPLAIPLAMVTSMTIITWPFVTAARLAGRLDPDYVDGARTHRKWRRR